MEHAYPTFVIPKKDGTVRWVSDFRKLNQMLRDKFTHYHEYRMYLTDDPVTNFSLRLISLCAAIPLNWTRRVKTYV